MLTMTLCIITFTTLTAILEINLVHYHWQFSILYYNVYFALLLLELCENGCPACHSGVVKTVNM